MATTKKMTKKDYYNMLLGLEQVKADSNLVEFIQKQIEQLEKKNSAEKKPTERQKENVGYKELILDVLEASESPMTVTEVMKADDKLSELSNQRVAVLLRQLMDDGMVVKTVDKRKSLFSLAAATE